MSLKVCFLLPRLCPSETGIMTGGCINNTLSLALELKKQGVFMELLAPVPQEHMKLISEHEASDIIRPLPSSGSGLYKKAIGDINVLRNGLKRRLSEIDYDVVHGHSGSYPYAFTLLASDRKRSVRIHSLYCPLGGEGGIYGKWWEPPFVVRRLLNRLDKVVAVTGNIRHSIEMVGISQDKIEFIPMSVDTRRFFPSGSDEPGQYFPDDIKGRRVVYVGNGSQAKGLIELLKAVSLLLKKGLTVSLVATIENSSNIREYTEGASYAKELVKELGIEKHVRFLGIVDDIERLYAESDIMVVPWNTTSGPSDYPMALIEYMAMGKCIVTTPIGGCTELLIHGKAGILTEGYSAESIASSLGYAVNNPDIQKEMGKYALAASEKYSLYKVGKQVIDMYENLVDLKSGVSQ